jgi:hypothetical protein
MGSDEKRILVGFFWHKVCELCDQEETTDLREEDFTFTCLSLSGFPTILVEMPKPRAITEALFVAILLLANFNEEPAPENPNVRYFVLELGQFLPDQSTHGVIGEWIKDKNSTSTTSNNKHLNYGALQDMSINSFLHEVEQHVIDKGYSSKKILLSTTVNDTYTERYTYKRYCHTPFEHLEFDILDKWEPIENSLEVVFTDAGENLPQLFFQTVGKTADFNDSLSFLEFLKTQKPNEQYLNIQSTKSNGYSAITFSYLERDATNIYVYGLIIDVGEGILWFYLKVPKSEEGMSHQIINRLITSLDFK